MHLRPLLWLLLLFTALFAPHVQAETLQAPIGGKAISIGTARIACAAPEGGWSIDVTGRLLKPPTQEDAIGKLVELKIAADSSECAQSQSTLRLVATGAWPSIDSNSVVFNADQNTLEARGRRLRGVSVAWRSDTASGLDTCQSPRLDPNAERCQWTLGRGLSADPNARVLQWVPAGGRAGTDVVTFDADGSRAEVGTFTLSPARVLVSALLPSDPSIDLSTGRGEVSLLHPEVIESVECSPARCELKAGKLVVRGISSDANSIDLKFALRPKVSLIKKDGSDAKLTAHIGVLHCPLEVASGPPLRAVDGSRIVLRMEQRCARGLPSLAFEIDDDPAPVIASEADTTGTYVLLDAGRIEKKSIEITARHTQGDDDVVAITHIDTRSPPLVRASLEIPFHKNLDFIPNNRPARVHTAPVPKPGKLVVAAIDGVYHLQPGHEDAIVGDADASGMVALRFAYRVPSLPGTLALADLAYLSDPLQRNVREANLPVPVADSAFSARPLVEVVCGPTLNATRLLPGQTAHLEFALRDDCRVVFHRERLPPEYGSQRLNLNIEVLNADGVARAAGSVQQTLTLRAGSHPIYAWIHGVSGQFDRVIVRLSHAADEAHYVGAAEIDTGAPALEMDRRLRPWPRAPVRHQRHPHRPLSLRRRRTQRRALAQLRPRLASHVARLRRPRRLPRPRSGRHGLRPRQGHQRLRQVPHASRHHHRPWHRRPRRQSFLTDSSLNQLARLGRTEHHQHLRQPLRLHFRPQHLDRQHRGESLSFGGCPAAAHLHKVPYATRSHPAAFRTMRTSSRDSSISSAASVSSWYTMN
ncbi:MAG: hypothetical protein QM756_01885 [Polyangiaceae bacterium]